MSRRQSRRRISIRSSTDDPEKFVVDETPLPPSYPPPPPLGPPGDLAFPVPPPPPVEHVSYGDVPPPPPPPPDSSSERFQEQPGNTLDVSAMPAIEEAVLPPPVPPEWLDDPDPPGADPANAFIPTPPPIPVEDGFPPPPPPPGTDRSESQVPPPPPPPVDSEVLVKSTSKPDQNGVEQVTGLVNHQSPNSTFPESNLETEHPPTLLKPSETGVSGNSTTSLFTSNKDQTFQPAIPDEKQDKTRFEETAKQASMVRQSKLPGLDVERIHTRFDNRQLSKLIPPPPPTPPPMHELTVDNGNTSASKKQALQEISSKNGKVEHDYSLKSRASMSERESGNQHEQSTRAKAKSLRAPRPLASTKLPPPPVDEAEEVLNETVRRISSEIAPPPTEENSTFESQKTKTTDLSSHHQGKVGMERNSTVELQRRNADKQGEEVDNLKGTEIEPESQTAKQPKQQDNPPSPPPRPPSLHLMLQQTEKLSAMKQVPVASAESTTSVPPTPPRRTSFLDAILNHSASGKRNHSANGKRNHSSAGEMNHPRDNSVAEQSTNNESRGIRNDAQQHRSSNSKPYQDSVENSEHGKADSTKEIHQQQVEIEQTQRSPTKQHKKHNPKSHERAKPRKSSNIGQSTSVNNAERRTSFVEQISRRRHLMRADSTVNYDPPTAYVDDDEDLKGQADQLTSMLGGNGLSAIPENSAEDGASFRSSSLGDRGPEDVSDSDHVDTDSISPGIENSAEPKFAKDIQVHALGSKPPPPDHPPPEVHKLNNSLPATVGDKENSMFSENQENPEQTAETSNAVQAKREKPREKREQAERSSGSADVLAAKHERGMSFADELRVRATSEINEPESFASELGKFKLRRGLNASHPELKSKAAEDSARRVLSALEDSNTNDARRSSRRSSQGLSTLPVDHDLEFARPPPFPPPVLLEASTTLVPPPQETMPLEMKDISIKYDASQSDVASQMAPSELEASVSSILSRRQFRTRAQQSRHEQQPQATFPREGKSLLVTKPRTGQDLVTRPRDAQFSITKTRNTHDSHEKGVDKRAPLPHPQFMSVFGDPAIVAQYVSPCALVNR